MKKHSVCAVGGLLLTLTLGGQVVLPWVGRATAQVSDVPAIDSLGNYSSAILPGNRGPYPSNRWLVMPQTDGYLNCRYAPGGPVRLTLVPGSIVSAKFNGPIMLGDRITPNRTADAIVFQSDRPWLRISATNRNLTFPPRDNRSSQDYIGECYVRANTQYIAPINNDSAY